MSIRVLWVFMNRFWIFFCVSVKLRSQVKRMKVHISRLLRPEVLVFFVLPIYAYP
jgi:hypothetical protein